MCSRSLNKLAQPLPMAHCANSRLVCKISGDVMNENNPPMMLPNGYVYGYNVSRGGGGRVEGTSCRKERGAVAQAWVTVWPVLMVRLPSQSLLSIRQDDKVVCPRTKEVFHFSQAEKVYIM